VLPVHRRYFCGLKPLGNRDHGCVDDAEREVHVLLDELRDARHIGILDLGYVEAVAAE
jgi:hypothetical protein